jgi:hypothetical protein
MNVASRAVTFISASIAPIGTAGVDKLEIADFEFLSKKLVSVMNTGMRRMWLVSLKSKSLEQNGESLCRIDVTLPFDSTDKIEMTTGLGRSRL